MDDSGDVGDDLLVLISQEQVARTRALGPEPTTSLVVTVPREVSDGLMEALAILPGVDLDTLASVVLRQVLRDLGVHDFPRRIRRRAEDPLVILY